MNLILGEETIIPFYFKDQFDNLVFDHINVDGPYFEIIGSFQSNICVSRDNIEIIFRKQALHMLKITWTDELRDQAKRCIDEGRGALNIYYPGIIADKLQIFIFFRNENFFSHTIDYGSISNGNVMNVSNSLITFFNQPSDGLLDMVNLATIDHRCYEGKQLPILGMIDIRNDIGLRMNMKLKEARSKISLVTQMMQSSFEFEIFSGPDGPGTFLFSLLI